MEVLGTEFSLQNSFVKTLTPNVTVYGDETSGK